MSTTPGSTTPTAYYIANVLLPVSILNMNDPTLSGSSSFKSCPLCNVPASEVTNVSTATGASAPTTNPNLTTFGNFFLNLIVNEFNTLFGTEYTPSDFSINSVLNNDQNSLCCYYLVNLNASFAITCYVELSNEVYISINFDDSNYNPY